MSKQWMVIREAANHASAHIQMSTTRSKRSNTASPVWPLVT